MGSGRRGRTWNTDSNWSAKEDSMPRYAPRRNPAPAGEPVRADYATIVASLDALGLTEPILIDGQPGHRITAFAKSLTEEQVMVLLRQKVGKA
jgi:hypothetical protein